MGNLKLYLSALTVAGLASLPMAAQQPSPSPSNPPQSSPAQPTPDSQQTAPAASASPVTSTANSPEAGNVELRPVQGELVSKLDSKKAKAGDSVVVKTTENATTADGIVIPKGSKIVGHVTDVQAAGNGNQNSKLTLQFDQAQLKGGQNLPIKSVLQSVSPAETMAGDTLTAPMGGAPGGAAPGTGASSSMGGSASGSRNTPAPPPQGGTPTVSAGGNAQAGNGAPAAGTVVSKQGNIAITTTAIPGVLIAANADGQPFSNASGALLGARQNIHLDGGTRVVLAVADAGTKGSNAR
jgi:co-chaperonin GroES (HSP10)